MDSDGSDAERSDEDAATVISVSQGDHGKRAMQESDGSRSTADHSHEQDRVRAFAGWELEWFTLLASLLFAVVIVISALLD